MLQMKALRNLCPRSRRLWKPPRTTLVRRLQPQVLLIMHMTKKKSGIGMQTMSPQIKNNMLHSGLLQMGREDMANKFVFNGSGRQAFTTR